MKDILNGSKEVEKLKDGVITKKSEIGGNSSKVTQNCFNFGKYRGKSYEEIKRDDPRYYEWCRENVKNFKG